MEVRYSNTAYEDLNYWKKKGTETLRNRISSLLNSIENTPFTGPGKPEPLKGNLSGKWSPVLIVPTVLFTVFITIAYLFIR